VSSPEIMSFDLELLRKKVGKFRLFKDRVVYDAADLALSSSEAIKYIYDVCCVFLRFRRS
jgi:hypothetical protein